MTKKQMVEAIEQTGKCLDFNRSYLMKQSKNFVERIYNTTTQKRGGVLIFFQKSIDKSFQEYDIIELIPCAGLGPEFLLYYRFSKMSRKKCEKMRKKFFSQNNKKIFSKTPFC